MSPPPLPNFLHIGAAKCASSWTWRICKEHPQICTPDTPDNVNFFTVSYHRGLDWYRQTYFANYDGQPAIGEFSNSYMVYYPAIERIARDLPDVRLICTIRNPVDRAFLNWSHMNLKRGKRTGLDMRQGIGIPFERCLHHHGHQYFRHFIEPGFYARHLQRILSIFPRQRLHVTLWEDLRADNAAFAADYFNFLGVDPTFTPTLLNQTTNPDPDDASMNDWVSPELQAELRAIYQDDIHQLQDLLNRDLTPWLKGSTIT